MAGKNSAVELNWRDIKRLAADGSDFGPAAAKLIRADNSEFESLLRKSQPPKWENCRALLGTGRKISVLRPEFPEVAASLSKAMLGPAAAEFVRGWLVAECNSHAAGASSTVDFRSVDFALQDLRALFADPNLGQIWGGLGGVASELEQVIKKKAKPENYGTSRDLRREGEANKLFAEDFPFAYWRDAPADMSPNVTRGAFDSGLHYLSTQRRLLSEDFLKPLRSDMQNIGSGSTDNLYSYGKCAILSHNASLKGRIELNLLLRDYHFISTDWESSQRLKLNSLLLLRVREGDFILATVAERDVGKLSRDGHFTACLIKSPDFERCKGIITVDVFESKAYFEAYRPVIEVLSRWRGLVPFHKYLVEAAVSADELEAPHYLRDVDHSTLTVDVTSVVQSRSLTPAKPLFDAGDVYRALMKERTIDQGKKKGDETTLSTLLSPTFECRLNASQLEAFQSCLSREFAIVQGPPGTGKSYVGKALLSFLLDNQSLWRRNKKSSPILVVCYTNQALDNVLEDMLGVTERIVRVGGRSSSDLLEKHNLNAIRRVLSEERIRDAECYKAGKEIEADLRSLKERTDRSLMDSAEFSEVVTTLNDMAKKSRKLDDLQVLESADLLRRADIVGVTTTGAAKNRRLLQLVGPEIVLMEEAGQVLEAHSLVALPSTCSHLILIGDHQQLRPTTASHVMARDFGLNVSLFERMVLNGYPYVRLAEQHRMRPEISAVVEATFYPGLANNESVRKYPDIRGVERNFFFVCHSNPDSAGSSETKSRSNEFEAKYTLRLAAYLVRRGYDARSITILTLYVGQMMAIKRLLSRDFPQLKGILVTVVDNYQGQESKIVLLSLVRSGADVFAGIGFLADSSRVCVALSRAQWGLYAVGNLDNLAHVSKTWAKVKASLFQCNVGPSLPLQCPRHTDIKAFDDFTKNFCREPCGASLPCGHRCPKLCHADDDDAHVTEATRCRQECERLCIEGHECKKNCSEPCNPCQYVEEKVLNCGHANKVPCASLNIPELCQFTKVFERPCGHAESVPCGAKLRESCSEKCSYLLAKCGHPCDRACHFDDGTDLEHLTGKCRRPCESLCSRGEHYCTSGHDCWQDCPPCPVLIRYASLPNCTHAASMPCHVDPNRFECPLKCSETRPDCGHRCRVFCHECRAAGGCAVIPCQERAEASLLECGHEVKSAIKCGEVATFKCKERCGRKVEVCGHDCIMKCYEQPCRCDVLVDGGEAENSLCGHSTKRPCSGAASMSKTAQPLCQEPCNKTLPCGHICTGVCSDCLGGRLHVPCREPCVRQLICGHGCEGGVCGAPCDPCKRKKSCLVSVCGHGKPCKVGCEDPCQVSCKAKCEFSCPHVTCEKKCSASKHSVCELECDKMLPCGHRCGGVCGEPCPSQCSVCIGESGRYIHLSGCGHDVPVKDVYNEDSNVAVHVCPVCATGVRTPHFLRQTAIDRKSEVSSACDKYFALKSGASKRRQLVSALCKDILEDCPDVIESEVRKIESRCRNERQPMAHRELVTAQIKLRGLMAADATDSVQKRVVELMFNAGAFGLDFVQQFVRLLPDGEDLVKLKAACDELASFEVGGWKMCRECGGKHVYFSAFDEKCSKSK